MRATLYKSSGKEMLIERYSFDELEHALEVVVDRFPKATLIVDGNQFKWLRNGEDRILISQD